MSISYAHPDITQKKKSKETRCLVTGTGLLALLWFNVFVVINVAARDGVSFGKDKDQKTFIGGDFGAGHDGGFVGGVDKGGGIAGGIGKGGGIGKAGSIASGICKCGGFGGGIGKAGGIGKGGGFH